MLDRVERYILCIGVFLAPLSTVRPTDLAITYGDVAFAILGVMIIVRRRSSLTPLEDATILWMFAFLCLFGGLFVSSIVNGSAARSIVVCTQYFFAYAFLPFIILSGDEDKALLIAKTYVFSIFFISICGFIFAATGYDGNQRYITGAGRLSSLSGNPNGLASQIALTMPILIYLWFSRLLPMIVCICIFVSLIIALIMTSSNGGLASTALGIAAFLLLTGNFRWFFNGAVVVTLAIVLTATVGRDYLPEVFERRVLGAFESGSLQRAGTYEDRMELNIEASDWLEETIVLGLGADQFRERSRMGEPVHNQYLIVWIEGGAIAFFGWLLILTTVLIVGVRGYNKTNGQTAAATVLSVTAVLAIVANTNPHLYARSYILPIFVAMGLVLAKKASHRPAMSEFRPGNGPITQPSALTKSGPEKTLAHRPAMHAQIRYGRRR